MITSSSSLKLSVLSHTGARKTTDVTKPATTNTGLLLLPPPEETNTEPFHKADLSGTEIDVFIFLAKSIEAKKKKKLKKPHRRFGHGSLSSSVLDPSFLMFSLFFFTRFFSLVPKTF
jgi:hypothetical protein